MGKMISHNLMRHGFHWLIVVMTGKMFNWGAIITMELSNRIEKYKKPKKSEVPSFYMDSY